MLEVKETNYHLQNPSSTMVHNPGSFDEPNIASADKRQDSRLFIVPEEKNIHLEDFSPQHKNLRDILKLNPDI